MAGYKRWATEVREYLFPTLRYTIIDRQQIQDDQFPKTASHLQLSAFQKVTNRAAQSLRDYVNRRSTDYFVFYQEATGYWVKATIRLPYYAKNDQVGAPAHGRYLYFRDPQAAHAACAVLNSSLFYVYFIAYGDCFHLSDKLTKSFPVNPNIMKDKELAALNSKLMADLKANAETTTIHTRDGDDIEYAEFYASKSKHIIDEIDRILARHYGFSAEEVDFILNYDIKYRLGQDDAGEGEA